MLILSLTTSLIGSFILLASAQTGVQNGRGTRVATHPDQTQDCYFESCTSDGYEMDMIVRPKGLQMPNLAAIYSDTNWPFLDVWNSCAFTGAMVVHKDRGKCLEGMHRIGIWAQDCHNVQPEKFLDYQICGSYTDGIPYKKGPTPVHISQGVSACVVPKKPVQVNQGESFDHAIWRRDQFHGCPNPDCKFSMCSSDPDEVHFIATAPDFLKLSGFNTGNRLESYNKYNDCSGPRKIAVIPPGKGNICKHAGASTIQWEGQNCRDACETYNAIRDPLLWKGYVKGQKLRSDGIYGERIN